jgi:ADP-ribose pyrophosphatase YjhB (NUDIX family)
VPEETNWVISEVKLFTIGAFAIIFDEQGLVLLCHREDLDVWNLPGGRVDSGEMPTDAVIREVMEETGLEVEIERLVGVYGKINKDELDFSFICHRIGGQLSIIDEAGESKFFEVNNLPINTNPKHVERIHDSVNPNDQPVFHRQTAPSIQEMLKKLREKKPG